MGLALLLIKSKIFAFLDPPSTATIIKQCELFDYYTPTLYLQQVHCNYYWLLCLNYQILHILPVIV